MDATNQPASIFAKPNQPRTPSLLFDLDGTLVDSVYEHVTSWRDALAAAGIRVPTWKIHRSIGMSGKLFLPALLREHGRKTTSRQIEALEKKRAALFTKKISGIAVLPGAKDIIKVLHRIRTPWALATSGDRNQVSKLTRGLAISREVPVITGDDIATAKPAPDAFVLAAEKLGASPEDCIVVGDSPWDHLAARRMKAMSVGVLSGGYSESELLHSGASRVYEDPGDLLMHLEELGIQTR
ncbi:MAG TPA: HAD family hydrolase [Candidatus Acidoferrum sp.]|jgi:HAD superfamily hydrolase (TIGR01509 family)